MRNAVMDELLTIAAADERVVFLTGDLGYGVVEPFFREFPDRAFNVGVAEQNMAAIAGGLAASGMIPFIYSIASFASMRPFEFIRNGAAVPGLPVRIVGVGGGMEYSNNGPTHFALEDVALFRALPGVRVVCPVDDRQARTAVRDLYARHGPIYLRLSKGTVPDVPGLADVPITAGAAVLEQGDGSVAVVGLGPLAAALASVRNVLGEYGVDATTAAVFQVAPEPVEVMASLAAGHRVIVTVEAHHVRGGLGSMVSEVVAELGIACRVVRLGVTTWPTGVVGGQAHLEQWAGIDVDSVVGAAVKALRVPGRG
jgi:transketolase